MNDRAHTTPLADQIADELAQVADRLAPLLGLDVAGCVRDRAVSAAPRIAAQLSCADDHETAQLVIDIGCALWPHSDPDPGWWRTPLGLACARSLGRDDAEAVTQSVAAAMLGVHPGTVSQLMARGTLDRHPDGGVLRASVLARLARLHGPSGQ